MARKKAKKTITKASVAKQTAKKVTLGKKALGVGVDAAKGSIFGAFQGFIRAQFGDTAANVTTSAVGTAAACVSLVGDGDIREYGRQGVRMASAVLGDRLGEGFSNALKGRRRVTLESDVADAVESGVLEAENTPEIEIEEEVKEEIPYRELDLKENVGVQNPIVESRIVENAIQPNPAQPVMSGVTAYSDSDINQHTEVITG